MLTVNQLAGFGVFGGGGNDTNTKLLLHMDGADASTTFTDSSATAVAVTPVGNAQIDTAQSKFGGASGLFDGTGDRLTVAANAAWNFGTGDFTVDCWVRVNSLAALVYLWDFRNGAGAAGTSILAFVATDGTLNAIVGGTTINSAAGAITTGVWKHIALVRSGSAITVYIDGVSIDTDTDATSIDCSGDAPRIGARFNDVNDLNGWLDEFRVSNVARWTTGFTPPETAYF